jgi:hypothetical protein
MTTLSGYLILADISGFAAYLAEVELTHAQRILEELYTTLMRHWQPYVADALVEGGALFGHIPTAHAPAGEAMLDFVETTYAAFRQHQRTMQHNTTCQCRACQTIATLDVKFFIHYGQYLRHHLGGQVDMMGVDVSLIRSRALKAPVVAETQWASLALFTAPALTQLALAPDTLPLHPQTIAAPPHGEVRTYSLDLRSRYEAQRTAHPVLITPEAADLVLAIELPVPPAVAWEWLTQPAKRTQWTVGRSWTARVRPQGRVGAGASNHCAHSGGHMLETILDWRPFDYVTSEYALHPGNFKSRHTLHLTPLENGHAQFAWRIALNLPRLLRPVGALLTRRMLSPDVHRLRAVIVAEARGARP